MANKLLFEDLPRDRKRIVRMHVIDAGDSGCCHEPGEVFVRFKCDRCGAESDWEYARNLTAARRGKPCHNCNS